MGREKTKNSEEMENGENVMSAYCSCKLYTSIQEPSGGMWEARPLTRERNGKD